MNAHQRKVFRTRVAREVAHVIGSNVSMPLNPNPPTPGKKKPIDRWLSIASLAAAILLFLLPKSPPIIVSLLVAMFLLLLHPLWNFWWIEKALWRRLIALMILITVSVRVAVVTWPRLEKPDLGFAFFTHEGELRFNIVNATSEAGMNPKFWFGIDDLTHPYAFPSKPKIAQPLPIPAKTLDDFARPKEGLGNFEVLNDVAKSHVRTGDRLFGVAFITCLNCGGQISYWLYYEVGGTGWYSPIRPGANTEFPYFQSENVSNSDINGALNKLVPAIERIPLPDRDSFPIQLTPHR